MIDISVRTGPATLSTAFRTHRPPARGRLRRLLAEPAGLPRSTCHGPGILLGALFGALLAGLAFGGFPLVAVGAFTGAGVAGCASRFAYCAGIQSDRRFSVAQCILMVGGTAVLSVHGVLTKDNPLYFAFVLWACSWVVGLVIALRNFGR